MSIEKHKKVFGGQFSERWQVLCQFHIYGSEKVIRQNQNQQQISHLQLGCLSLSLQ
jgi:hypothetical protein